jgi:hypothetical protein
VNRQGGPRRWTPTIFFLAAAALAAACTAPGAGPRPPAPPTASAPSSLTTPAPPASLAEWQRRGATEVPPPELQQVSLRGIDVLNQTSGAVSDRDAQAWAESLLRTYQFVLWAVSRGQDGFLLNSGLSSAAPAVFQPNFNDILQARQAGARVEYSREVFRRLVLRPVPPGLQPKFQVEQFRWKPYAFFLDALGPISTTWIDRSGNRSVKSQIADGVPAFELMGGEFSHDPLLGDVWIVGSDWNCTAASSRAGLAPLCNA